VGKVESTRDKIVIQLFTVINSTADATDGSVALSVTFSATKPTEITIISLLLWSKLFVQKDIAG
jgi:hypothetical protein